ncbi:MAG: GNAT family N-acetyltransferase [Candidatus Peribacteraceae bacterium]|nr:GNAT family N-acetyltransferase [Candidatus Peribacteraceae bacterium]
MSEEFRIVIRDIDIETGRRDFAGLIIKHWQEVAMYQDKVELDVNWEQYENMYMNGNVLALGAYNINTDNSVEIPIGYIMDVMSHNPHYQQDVFAMNDVIYVDPYYRKTGLGARLIKISENKLRKLGVSVRTLHIKTTHDFSKLAEHLGYGSVERVHGKYLGE